MKAKSSTRRAPRDIENFNHHISDQRDQEICTVFQCANIDANDDSASLSLPFTYICACFNRGILTLCFNS